MVTKHTVCLCFGYEKCLAETKQLAEKNGAVDFEVVPVATEYPVRPEFLPACRLAYKGVLIMKGE